MPFLFSKNSGSVKVSFFNAYFLPFLFHFTAKILPKVPLPI
jgi:hypothetical protein